MTRFGSFEFQNKPALTVAVGAICGSVIFLLGAYHFVDRVIFLSRANAYDAPIAYVSYEHVPAGRGSVLAYVPLVEITDRQSRTLQLKVETSDEKPIYAVGQRMQVVCDPAQSCIKDTFFAAWGVTLISFLISLACFVPLALYRSGYWDPDDEFTPLGLQDVQQPAERIN